MERDQGHSPLDVMAYTMAVLAIISVLDANPRGSGMWWSAMALIAAALLATNLRHRRLCARLNQLEPGEAAKAAPESGSS